jgi:hypothetical protein
VGNAKNFNNPSSEVILGIPHPTWILALFLPRYLVSNIEERGKFKEKTILFLFPQ